MSSITIGTISIIFLLLLIALRVHVGISLAITGFLGIFLLTNKLEIAMGVLTTTPYFTVGQYAMAVVPLFILMGMWVGTAGIAEGAYRAAGKWMGRMPGGLALATVAANTIFGAACGSSVVACAVFTKFGLPEMRRHGYNTGFAAGVIASTGVLAMLIPPSVLMVIYGILTEQSIGDLFMAGVFPGLLLAVAFGVSIIVIVRIRRDYAPRPASAASWRERFLSLRHLWGIVLLIALVMGGIYGGVFTPTEAGAAGAWGALLLMALVARTPFRTLWASFLEASSTAAIIFFILIGATIYAKFLALSGLPTYIISAVTTGNFPPMAILALFVLVYLFLGTLLDSISMMTITLPIMLPVAIHLGWDPIWFGIVVIVAIELGLITPPVGLNVYVVQATSNGEVPVETIFKHALPFYVAFIITLALIMLFPIITTWLPGTMM